MESSLGLLRNASSRIFLPLVFFFTMPLSPAGLPSLPSSYIGLKPIVLCLNFGSLTESFGGKGECLTSLPVIALCGPASPTQKPCTLPVLGALQTRCLVTQASVTELLKLSSVISFILFSKKNKNKDNSVLLL